MSLLFFVSAECHNKAEYNPHVVLLRLFYTRRRKCH